MIEIVNAIKEIIELYETQNNTNIVRKMKQIEITPEDHMRFIDESKLPLITNPFKEEWNHYEHSHNKTQITFVDYGLLKVNIDNQIYLITSGF